MANKLCVVSMSGGLDSATLAMRAIEEGYTVLPINIKYGQKNAVEKLAFKKLATFYSRNFPDQFMEPIELNLEAMLDTSLKLYQDIRDSKLIENSTDMEFYTPSRNLVFSTLAAMIGEIAVIADEGNELLVGLGIHKHTQYDRDYWDITPEFVKRLNYLFELNDCIKVKMFAPYAEVPKSAIVQDAVRLGVPYEDTWTCYNPVHARGIYEPCLVCEACIERQTAGDAAGIQDINNYYQKGKL
jgi:7-cyano-7-deazaguanine synthase